MPSLRYLMRHIHLVFQGANIERAETKTRTKLLKKNSKGNYFGLNNLYLNWY